MILADNDTLWIGMTKCTDGERYNNGQPYGCLTMYNTATGKADYKGKRIAAAKGSTSELAVKLNNSERGIRETFFHEEWSSSVVEVDHLAQELIESRVA